MKRKSVKSITDPEPRRDKAQAPISPIGCGSTFAVAVDRAAFVL
jgi:hypothetical protein